MLEGREGTSLVLEGGEGGGCVRHLDQSVEEGSLACNGSLCEGSLVCRGLMVDAMSTPLASKLLLLSSLSLLLAGGSVPVVTACVTSGYLGY